MKCVINSNKKQNIDTTQRESDNIYGILYARLKMKHGINFSIGTDVIAVNSISGFIQHSFALYYIFVWQYSGKSTAKIKT